MALCRRAGNSSWLTAIVDAAVPLGVPAGALPGSLRATFPFRCHIHCSAGGRQGPAPPRHPPPCKRPPARHQPLCCQQGVTCPVGGLAVSWADASFMGWGAVHLGPTVRPALSRDSSTPLLPLKL